MKPIDHPLWRLLQAAAQAPKTSAEQMPFGFDTRVLAQWRSRPREDDFAWLLSGLFRRAVICASLLMVACIVWGSHEKTSTATSVVALANYEINQHLPP
jgi:hypothetical protein